MSLRVFQKHILPRLYLVSHFDLVIDTKENDIPAVERLIIEGYEAWKMR
jgi:hypothetical protein